jgi:hypothetical protein
MKKQILLLAVFMMAAFYQGANAQVSIGVNIGIQPVWGPVGYDHADYYYFPDIETYYDVQARMYTWFDHGAWITRPELPPRYRTFDLYHSYKAVINEPRPWMHHDRFRGQYIQFRGRHDQMVIRDSHEPKYFENPGHPEHAKWHGAPRHEEERRHEGGRHEEERHEERR